MPLAGTTVWLPDYDTTNCHRYIYMTHTHTHTGTPETLYFTHAKSDVMRRLCVHIREVRCRDRGRGGGVCVCVCVEVCACVRARVCVSKHIPAYVVDLVCRVPLSVH